MTTKPSDIKQPRYLQIWERLQALQYPCTIVVYGPERTYRTTYRGEHEGAFGIDFCQSAEQAWNVVDCGYPGWPGDLKVYAIAGTEPEEL